MLTAEDLRQIAGPKATKKHTEGVIDNLDLLEDYGLLKPWRLAQFIAQIGHESDRFKTTSEYASGKAYEGRADLGNTRPGDGVKYKGHGLIQCTGRANHTDFTAWAKARYSDAPDFVKNPKALTEYPWALIVSVWYWETRKLNRYADEGNVEMITRRINGGLNGFADRCTLYDRTALVLLGYELKAKAIEKFQRDAKRSGLYDGQIDDIPGPKTRAAFHETLLVLHLDIDPVEAGEADAAPVVIPPIPQPPPPAEPINPSPAPTPTTNFIQAILSALRRLFQRRS